MWGEVELSVLIHCPSVPVSFEINYMALFVDQYLMTVFCSFLCRNPKVRK
jgi:hypothetical protein